MIKILYKYYTFIYTYINVFDHQIIRISLSSLCTPKLIQEILLEDLKSNFTGI